VRKRAVLQQLALVPGRRKTLRGPRSFRDFDVEDLLCKKTGNPRRHYCWKLLAAPVNTPKNSFGPRSLRSFDSHDICQGGALPKGAWFFEKILCVLKPRQLVTMFIFHAEHAAESEQSHTLALPPEMAKIDPGRFAVGSRALLLELWDCRVSVLRRSDCPKFPLADSQVKPYSCVRFPRQYSRGVPGPHPARTQPRNYLTKIRPPPLLPPAGAPILWILFLGESVPRSLPATAWRLVIGRPVFRGLFVPEGTCLVEQLKKAHFGVASFRHTTPPFPGPPVVNTAPTSDLR